MLRTTDKNLVVRVNGSLECTKYFPKSVPSGFLYIVEFTISLNLNLKLNLNGPLRLKRFFLKQKNNRKTRYKASVHVISACVLFGRGRNFPF